MARTDNRFIGGGMIFPIEINAKGRVNIYRDLDLVRASILHILAWPMRHRFFNEEFGSRLEELLEEPDTAVARSIFRRFVIDAITRWEKRIELVDLEILETTPTVIKTNITYRIRLTKQQDSFIFPFYREIIY